MGQPLGEHWISEVFFSARAKVMGTDDLAELLALDPPVELETLEARFWHWIDNPALPMHTASSLRSTLHHYDLMLGARDRSNVVVFHYSDLKKDLDGEMRRLAARLGITVAEQRWPELVDAASFERMRSRADELAPNTTDNLWKDNRQFFHSGTGGHWRDFFDAEAGNRYQTRIAELTTPAVAAWGHDGSRRA